MTKTKYNFSVDEDVLAMAQQLAKWQSRTVSNMLEYLIKQEWSNQSTAYAAGLDRAKEILSES